MATIDVNVPLEEMYQNIMDLFGFTEPKSKENNA